MPKEPTGDKQGESFDVYSGDSHNLRVTRGPRLFMYLDEDRDGKIDKDRAKCEKWTWGEKDDFGRGAIIMVKTSRYEKGDEVKERMKIHFKWEGVKEKPKWEATLKVDKPDKVRIFDDDIEGDVPGNCEGATMVLGPPSESEEGSKEFKINDWWPIYDKINKNNEGDLWIEAVDFPEKEDGSDSYVELRFEFTEDSTKKGLARTSTIQTAVVGIAPWIMASDLDPTHHVWLRNTANRRLVKRRVNDPKNDISLEDAKKIDPNIKIDQYLEEPITEPLVEDIAIWVNDKHNIDCKKFMVGSDKASKGFARDIMKAGYCVSPHFSGVAIQSPLDNSPLNSLPERAAQEIRGGTFTKPIGIKPNQLLGQDNGGNLLVSPPTDAWPYGRILFGGDDNEKCHSEAFYRAQKVQRPIRLNSTWLRVGHVDEMLSIVRCGDGSYIALLLSLRLAYIMLRGVASRTDASAADLIAWAIGINNDCIESNIYTGAGISDKLNNLDPYVASPNPASRFAQVGREPIPAAPADANRFVILRLDNENFATFIRGSPLVGQAGRDFRRAFPRGSDSFEFQVHSKLFLDRTNAHILNFLDQVQGILDDTRKILRDELGFTNNKIIEVPVLVNAEGGKYVALTGDSVNLLQLAGKPASHCLVPMPFGPVFEGEYVFQKYLSDKFAEVDIDIDFLADDKFHVAEGEIHCGTNQTFALPEDRKAWWDWRSP